MDRVNRDELRVERAAILFQNVVYSLAPPARHSDVIRHMRQEHGITEEQSSDWEQGFVLNDGRFARRKPAGLIAVHNGQIKALKWPPNLYSEDLW